MVKLRLRRRGRKRLPVYDIVAADSRSPRDGRIIERVGQYSPLVSSGATMLDRERVSYWLKTGAQPTDTVRNILSREGVLLAMQMEAKGASAEEITTAVDAHVMRQRSREAIKANMKKAGAEEAEAAEAAEAEATEEAPTETETPAAEAEATEEAPTEAVAEEAPAAEAEATEEAPAETTAPEAEATEEAPAAEETPAEASEEKSSE